MNENKMDEMFTLLDAWMLSERGEDPSKAIENQERRGQAKVTKAQRLPKRIHDHNVPNDIFFMNVTDNMDYEKRREITRQNVEAYTRVQYEKMGIDIVNDFDDLFWNVKLPEGWEIKATEHPMWNEVRDAQGRKRMTFFYKAAFYDRDAFSNLQTRFQLEVTHTADPGEDYNVWSKSNYRGTIKDGDVVILQTRELPPTGNYAEDDKLKDLLWEELETFMKEHWPKYKDVHAYWE